MKSNILILLLLLTLSASGQSFWNRFWTVDTLSYTDPEHDEVSWSITAGNTDKVFWILPCSGILKVDTLAYNKFITQKTYLLTLKVVDPVGNVATKKKKVVLKKTASGIKQKPVISDV